MNDRGKKKTGRLHTVIEGYKEKKKSDEWGTNQE